MNQRGSIIPVIALLFGAAVVVTIFGYMMWPKDSESDTSVVVDVNKVGVNASSGSGSVKDWKSYSNSDYNFSFQYPEGYKDLTIAKSVERAAWSLNSDNVLKESGTTKALMTLLSQPQAEAEYPSLEVNVFPLDKYYYIDRPGGVVYIYHAGDIWNGEGDEVISNPKLKRIQGKNTSGFLTGSGDMGTSRTTVLFVNQRANQIVELNFTSISALDGSEDVTTKNQDIWKKVVSTFSFDGLTTSTSNTNTAVEPGIDDWKRYSNTALKYTYRYPNDLKSNECTNNNIAEYSFVSADGVPCGTEWFGNGFGFSKQSSNYNQSTTIKMTQDAIVSPVTSSVEIDGVTATRVRGVTKSGPDVMGGGNRYNDIVFVTRQGVGYIINSLSITNTAYRQSDFERFLDTIDFTD